MFLRRTSPARTLAHAPGTRVLAILLCLSLLLGAQPVPAGHAATLTVINTNDHGPGSLRRLITIANAGDEIIFGSGVTGTITLTSGQIIIEKDLTITGPGESTLTVSGGGSSRVFRIPYEDYDVTISGLTIANGVSLADRGGGLYNRSTGTVRLQHVTFKNNGADRGGGMFNWGTGEVYLEQVTFEQNNAYRGGGLLNRFCDPTLTNVTFSGNTATGYGGGMHNNGSSPTLTDVTFSENTATLHGGGLYNEEGSHPALTNVTFSDNDAHYGGGMSNTNSNPTLTDVEFTGNHASVSSYDGKGGGMYNYGSNPTLIDVTFRSNDSEFGAGGGMYNETGSNPALTDVVFDSNYASEDAGGGMFNDGSSPTLTDVIFRSNWANGNGGGMFNEDSSPTLTGVTFSSNSAEYNGGGMSNTSGSNPTLTDVTFSSNRASYNDGGGMCNQRSSPDLTNVTFSGNWASINGGGMYNNFSSDPILRHVTISGNSAVYGGGLYSESVNTPTLRSTIVSGNSAGTGPDCYGTLNSGDYNLIGDPSFCNFSPQANDQIGVDPLLGPLADNGGETLTRALLTGSPAIDWIPLGVNGCGTTVTSDQRGEARPVPAGGNCDIGAYEYVPPPLPETGFPPGEITALPAQPTEKTYTTLGDLWLELPALGVQAPIVSIPFVSDNWDVSWLGESVGYLPGSAFPTWQGNTVLTGHVWDAFNRPGLFANLKQLRYGDRVEIHAWGATYTYAVRESRLVSPEAVDVVMQHKELDWVTLLTCEDYRIAGEAYAFRRLVRAVLVEVVPNP